MSKIIAKGDGITVTVEEHEGAIRILFDGEEDDFMLDKLNQDVIYAPPMGGTFYPEPGTMLAYYNALGAVFFNELEEINVTGDIGEMPCEDGLIY